MRFGKILTQIVNKNNTPVEVTDDNKLKVDASGSTVTLGSGGVQKTATLERYTNTDSVAETTDYSGSRSISFFNAGPDDCTVAGTTLKAGESVTFSAGGEDDTLGNIAWTANTSASSEILIAIVS